MSKPRADLDAMLDRLSKALPGMLAALPDDADFWPAFAGEADEIVDNAWRDDDEHVQSWLDALLVGASLTPRPGVQ
jgi:hypothetical protein